MSISKQLLLVLLFGCSAVATCYATEYPVHNPQPATGTSINRSHVSSSFPLGLRYDELTAQQQAEFRDQYNHLAATDTPPFPAVGAAAVGRAATRAQAGANLDGKLVFTVHINTAGDAVSVAIYQTPDESATADVTTAAMNIKYTAAKCGDVACEKDFPYVITFRR